ncbi:hypothetical protein N7537_010539 [Penicillium hordei]|uniref:Methyltransferase domain-containing protein n=1 Tax=Penicillium hordei TaxID=40994 RepID=A0AAD6DVJ1_9EURO|nr:uncharacterized protein N7537_010539 [Penicillium hordei]KAJ5593635.1 hypothetical protein N7537_010539 [Penicillium hordei]
MASFLSKSFGHKGYAAFRPTYPAELYKAVLSFHQGSPDAGRSLALDLGTGHGLVARELSPHFGRVIGTDPSAGMIAQAREISTGSSATYPNVSFHQAAAESSPFVYDRQVNLVTAAQASHWFHYPKLWPELARIMQPGGTLAFWGYKDHVLVSHPKASDIIEHFAYQKDPTLLGSYWQQPGRRIVQEKLRAVVPPAAEWYDITRVEYEPSTQGLGSGQGTRFMSARMTLGAMEEYMRTWSSFHKWQQQFPDQKRREEYGSGDGDVIDRMMDAIREAEPALRGEGSRNSVDWKAIEVDVEWGSALVLARKRS